MNPRVRALAAGAVVIAGALLAAARARAVDWSFTDVTTAAGLVYEHGYVDNSFFNESRFIAGGVAAGDYNRDGWPDLYVVRGDIGPNLLFRNRGDGTFAEVGAAAGVALEGALGAGPTFADVDGDGWLDLIVLGVGFNAEPPETPPILFHNRGDGTFEDVTTASGITATRDSFSATFADYDRDGDLDVFISHWATEIRAPQMAKELLWRNDGEAGFVDVSVETGVSAVVPQTVRRGLPDHFYDLTFTPNFADIDSDGWPDLLLASDFESSAVLRNDRQGGFVDATTAVIDDENGMGGAVGDYDNDGDLDWFVSSIFDITGVPSEFGNWGITGNRLYANDGTGSFTDVSMAAGVRHGGWGWGSTFADVNNDGRLDIFHVNGWGPLDDIHSDQFHADTARLFIANGDGSFTDQALALGAGDPGEGRGVVALDYDRDGDLDLFIANNAGAPHLLRNDGGNSRRFLGVKLIGRRGNTEAIGARVTVTSGGQTQMRELRAGSNFESQDPAEAHFGLGDATRVDEVEVKWPNGETTALGALESNQLLAIAQPGAITCRDPLAGGICIAGGGEPSTDCFLALVVDAPRATNEDESRAMCREGDPRCDFDPDDGNGSCTFHVSLCINNSDARLPSCAPSAVAALRVLRPKANSLNPTDARNRAALERALGTGSGGLGMAPALRRQPGAAGMAKASPDLCGAPVDVIVPRRLGDAANASGRRRIALMALAADGRRDADSLRLECQSPVRGRCHVVTRGGIRGVAYRVACSNRFVVRVKRHFAADPLPVPPPLPKPRNRNGGGDRADRLLLVGGLDGGLRREPLRRRSRMMRIRAFAPALLVVLLSGKVTLGVACPGDCDNDGFVRTDELVRCVEIALDAMAPDRCIKADLSGDQQVTIDEVVAAVEAAVAGCPTPPPTASASAQPTATRTPTVTRPPTATPTPTLNAPPALYDQIYTTYPGYPIALSLAADPEGDGVSCALESFPDGAGLDEAASTLNWMPSDEQLGPFSVDLSCTDDGEPPASASGRIAIQVNPVDACSRPQCDPAAGCTSPLPTVNEMCCANGPAVHVPQATADCPGGRVVFAGRNDDATANGMGRLQNCDRFRVLNSGQSSANVRFHIETRCMDLSQSVTLRARMETSTRVLFNRDRIVPLRLEADGYARAYSITFSVGGDRPYFDLTDAEANLTLTLFDGSGNQVTSSVRVILGFNALPDIPRVE